MSLDRNPVAYLANPANLHKMQVAYYRFLLDYFKDKERFLTLENLYELNGGVVKTNNPLEMIDYLGKQQHIDVPDYIMRHVNALRAFNKARLLQVQAAKLNNINAANEKDSTEAGIARQRLRLNKNEQGKALQELAEFTANPNLKKQIKSWPRRKLTNMTYINNLYSSENDAKKQNPYENAQQYVDALRNNDFAKFLTFVIYVYEKYNRLRPETEESLGADQLADLLALELSKTDLNVEDVKKIRLLAEAMPHPSRVAIDSTDAGAFQLLHNNAVHIAVVSVPSLADQLTTKFFSGITITTNQELKNFFKKMQNRPAPDEAQKSKIKAIDRQTTPSTKEINQFKAENEHRIIASMYGTDSIEFKNYILNRVNIEDVDAKLRDCVPKAQLPQLQRELYRIQISKAQLIKDVQLDLKKEAVMEQHKIELPRTYKAYLDWIKDEKNKKYLTDIPNSQENPPETMSQPNYNMKILQPLQKNAAQVAQQESTEELGDLNSLSHAIHRSLIKNIRHLIETIDWGARVRGETRKINGVKKLLPLSVDRIYQLCLQADEPGKDLEKLYHQIEEAGAKANNSFSFFRRQNTKNLLQDLADSYNNRQPSK